jgi:hypothetical protein
MITFAFIATSILGFFGVVAVGGMFLFIYKNRKHYFKKRYDTPLNNIYDEA